MSARRPGSAIQPPFLIRFWVEPDRADLDAFPFDRIPFLSADFAFEFEAPVTIITGDNGTGKSTLLELIAVHAGFHASGGRRFHQLHDDAGREPMPWRDAFRFAWRIKTREGFFFRADRFEQVARYIDREGDLGTYGGAEFGAQSHGEALSALFGHGMDVRSRSLFLLDEPEAALSPTRQLAFLGFLRGWEQSRQAQVILVTHSPIIMAYPGAQLLQIADGAITPVDFRETEHYRVTKAFLNDPEAFLPDLLDDEA